MPVRDCLRAPRRGFTLIETLVYLALFAMMIGGGLVATYQIIQSTESVNRQMIVQEEANFILRKIDWAMSGAMAVSVGASPPTVTVTKPGLTLVFDVSGVNLRLNRGTGAVVLNSSNVKVENAAFTPVHGPPEGIIASFMLNGQQFTTTKYLRR